MASAVCIPEWPSAHAHDVDVAELVLGVPLDDAVSLRARRGPAARYDRRPERYSRRRARALRASVDAAERQRDSATPERRTASASPPLEAKGRGQRSAPARARPPGRARLTAISSGTAVRCREIHTSSPTSCYPVAQSLRKSPDPEQIDRRFDTAAAPCWRLGDVEDVIATSDLSDGPPVPRASSRRSGVVVRSCWCGLMTVDRHDVLLMYALRR
jgi:hypothetical protein